MNIRRLDSTPAVRAPQPQAAPAPQPEASAAKASQDALTVQARPQPEASLSSLVSRVEAARVELGAKSGAFESRVVLSNPAQVSDRSFATSDVAAAAVEKGKAAERRAYEALPSDQKKQYATVLELIQFHDPGRLALQTLLVSGQLTKERDLLPRLSALAEQPLASGLDRDDLVSHVLQEVADPAAISQAQKATCGATVGQIMLAKARPADYVRMVAGLASPEGKAPLANGKTLSREADWNAEDGGRSLSSRLLQPAFMEYANGENLDYNNTKDRNFRGTSQKDAGLSIEEAEHLYEGLMGRPFKLENAAGAFSGDGDRAELFSAIIRQAGQGKLVPTGITWGDADAGHQVLVDGIKGDSVTYLNPWGQKEAMGFKEFRDRLLFATLPQ